MLFDGPENQFGLNFFAQNRSIKTDQLFFTPDFSDESVVVSGPEVRKGSEGRLRYNENHPGGTEKLGFRLEVGSGQYLEYVYTLGHNSFMVDMEMNFIGLDKFIASNQSYINFTWSAKVPRQERISRFGEDRYTNLKY